jgi:hypothetical protein
MRQAIVSVRDGDGSALGLDGLMAAVQEAGLQDVDVLTCEGPRAVVRVYVNGAVPTDRFEDVPAVVWVERAAGDGPGETYLLEVDVESAETMIDACSADLVMCGTIDVSERGVTFDVAGPQDAIAETVEKYDAAGADVSLETLRDYEYTPGPVEALTDRQREVLAAAYDRGYFEVPRQTTTEDLAEAFDLDSSTVSEHLVRAQRNLLSGLMAESA